MPKITAVIIAYWPSRAENIPFIVRTLSTARRVPDHIIILNNNTELLLPPIEGASIVNAQANYTSRAKYAAAMLEPSDYYLLLDDDVGANRGTLEYLEKIAYPGCCLCDTGFQMVNNFGSDGKLIGAWDVIEPTKVDLFMGRMQFLSFQAIVKTFAAEAIVRLPDVQRYRSVGEDMLVALANESYVFPWPRGGDANTAAPPTLGATTMARDAGSFQLRDEFCYKAWLALGHEPFPGPKPGDSINDRTRCNMHVKLLKDRDEGRVPCEMTAEEMEQYERDNWAACSSPAPTGS